MEKGFSLFELLTVLAISTLAVTLASPLASTLLSRARAQSDANLLHSTLNSARFYAVTNGVPITVLAKQNNWSSGWQVFVDADNDLQPDTSQIIILDHGPRISTIATTSTLLSRVRFLPDGRAVLRGGGFQAGTFTICDNNTHSYDLIINRIGRVRRSELEHNPKCSIPVP